MIIVKHSLTNIRHQHLKQFLRIEISKSTKNRKFANYCTYFSSVAYYKRGRGWRDCPHSARLSNLSTQAWFLGSLPRGHTIFLWLRFNLDPSNTVNSTPFKIRFSELLDPPFVGTVVDFSLPQSDIVISTTTDYCTSVTPNFTLNVHSFFAIFFSHLGLNF